MIFYILLTVITTGVVFFCESSPLMDKIKMDKEKIVKYSLTISAIILIMTLSLKSLNVGDDTMEYYNFFLNPYKGFAEIGFYYLVLVTRYFSDNYNVFLFIVACISIIPIYYVIYKMNGFRWVYVFLYQALVIFIFNFAIIRQVMAMSILVLAYYIYYKNGKYRIPLTVGLVIIATLFHRIALIAIPILLFLHFNKYINRKIIVILMLFSILLCVFYKPILSLMFSTLFPDKKEMYLNNLEISFGLIPSSVFIFEAIACWYYVKEKDDKLKLLMNINYCFIYISLFMFWFPSYGRILQFGYLNSVFLLGLLYNKISENGNRYIKAIFILIWAFFYLFMLFRNPYHVIPYELL